MKSPNQHLRLGHLLGVLLSIFLGTHASAQLRPQPSAEIEHRRDQEYRISWKGLPGRAYFIQTSTNVSEEEGFNWEFMPDVLLGSGNDLRITVETQDDEATFFRLIYADYSGSLDVGAEDFDDDGYTNLEEAMDNTDPFDPNSFSGDPRETPDQGDGEGPADGEDPPRDNQPTIDLDKHEWAYSLKLSAYEGDETLPHIVTPDDPLDPLTFLLINAYRGHVKVVFEDLKGENEVVLIHLELNLGTDSKKTPWIFREILRLSKDNSEWVATVQADELSGADGALLPVRQKEVRFSGASYHELKNSDLSVTYSAPQWLDKDDNGDPSNSDIGERNHSIAYTRDTKPSIGATFGIEGFPNSLDVMIRAAGNDGFRISETKAQTNRGSVTLRETEAQTNWPKEVKFYDRSDSNKAFKLDWEIKVEDGDWTQVASTKHQIYLTLDNPTTALKQETVYYLACSKAEGLTDRPLIVDAVYSNFQDENQGIQRISSASGDPDGRDLTYWAKPFEQNFTPAKLLKSGDGKCAAWAKLFIEVLKVHSIASSEKNILPPIFTSVDLRDAVEANLPEGTLFRYNPLNARLFVRKWNTNGNPFLPRDLKGIAAQGNKNPHSRFANHCVVLFGNKIYDPSYGTGPFPSQLKWEDFSIDAFGARIEIKRPGAEPTSINWIWKKDKKGTQETR